MAGTHSVAFGRLCDAFLNDRRIAALYLFGSHARNSAGALSDVDLAILLRKEIAASDYFTLRLEYLSAFASVLRCGEVDGVVLNHAPIHLAYAVVSRGKLLLDLCPEERVAFEADRMGRFLDIKPWLAVQLRATKQQLLAGGFFD